LEIAEGDKQEVSEHNGKRWIDLSY
jgi:hypothetical protein